jgi:hypothetical protein
VRRDIDSELPTPSRICSSAVLDGSDASPVRPGTRSGHRRTMRRVALHGRAHRRLDRRRVDGGLFVIGRGDRHGPRRTRPARPPLDPQRSDRLRGDRLRDARRPPSLDHRSRAHRRRRGHDRRRNGRGCRIGRTRLTRHGRGAARRRGRGRGNGRGRSSDLYGRCSRRRRGSACRQERQRVEVALRLRSDPDAEVDVRQRHVFVATRADDTDGAALRDRRALSRGNRAEMRQRHRVPVRRRDRHALAR